MTIDVAINGFGRIGRQVFRILHDDDATSSEVVAVNDLGNAEALVHLLKYDSTHGRFDADVEARGRQPGRRRPRQRSSIYNERDPLGAALERPRQPVRRSSRPASSVTRAQLEQHIAAGATQGAPHGPAEGPEVDALVVLGVNDDVAQARAQARLATPRARRTVWRRWRRCSTRQVRDPVKGLMNTIHAYTNDQRILDLEHKDLRRARSAATNIIPTTTGAARAVGKVLPVLGRQARRLRRPRAGAGRLDSRPDGDPLARGHGRGGQRGLMKEAAEGPMEGHHPLQRGADRLERHHRRPALQHLRRAAHDGDGLARSRSAAGTTTSGATRPAASTSSRRWPRSPVALRGS